MFENQRKPPWTSQQVFDSARQMLQQGNTGQALQTLIDFLEKTGTQPEALRILRVVNANENAARTQEQRGILSFAEAQREYAKSRDAVLSVIDDLAAGRKPTLQFTPARDGNSTRLAWLIGGGVLLLFGLIAGILLTRNGQENDEKGIEPAKTELNCPDFDTSGFTVMILQFQNLGTEKRQPELGIQTRIRDLTAKNQLLTDVKIIIDQRFELNTPDIREATRLGKQCAADMVIWGQYEPLDKNAISVDINYAFTDATWPPGKAIQTFKNVSEIKTGSMEITDLDEAVFRICTALALHENRMDLAEKWLNKLKMPNPREQGWKEMLAK